MGNLNFEKVPLILLIVCLALLILNFFYGMMRGFRKSVIALAANIVSGILAVFVSKAGTKAVYARFEDRILSFLSNKVPEELLGNEVIYEILLAFVIALLAVLIYTILYLGIYILMKIPVLVVSLITKKQAEQKKSFTGTMLGALVSVANTAVFIIFFLSTTAGLLHLSKEVMEQMMNSEDETITERVETAYYTYAPLMNSTVMNGVYYAGGNVVFQQVAKLDVEGANGGIDKEAKAIAETVVYAMPLKNMNMNQLSDKDVVQLRKVEESAMKSELATTLFSEVLSDACSAWAKGDTYIGVAAPAAEGALSGVLRFVFATYSDTTKDDLKDVLDTVIDFVELIVKYDLISAVSETQSLIQKLGNEALLSDLFLSLYDNTKLRPAISELANAGLESACKLLKVDADEVVAEPVDMKTVTREEMEREAKVMAEAITSIYEIYTTMQSSASPTKIPLATVGKAIASIEQSIFFGPSSNKLLAALLRSEMFSSFGFITDNMISMVENGELDIAELLKISEDALKVMSGFSGTSGGDVSESLQSLIGNMDSQTAAAISGLISPELLKSIGIEGENAEQVSSMVSEMFTQMSALSASGDEAAVQEAESVMTLMNVVTAAAMGNTDNLLESSGTTPEELVDSIVSSQVISGTIASMVTDSETGETITDPLGLGSMSSSEKEVIADTIGAYYEKNADADTSGELAKTLSDIGALFGIDVTGYLN